LRCGPATGRSPVTVAVSTVLGRRVRYIAVAMEARLGAVLLAAVVISAVIALGH
jgi:hypothetical protein